MSRIYNFVCHPNVKFHLTNNPFCYRNMYIIVKIPTSYVICNGFTLCLNATIRIHANYIIIEIAARGKCAKPIAMTR